MIARNQRDGFDLVGLEAAKVSVFRQIVRVLVMTLVADVDADVVQDGGVLEPLALAIRESVDRARVIEKGDRELRHLVRVLRPEMTPFGQLEDAAAANVRIAIGLGDLLAMTGNVIEDEPLAKGQIAQCDFLRAEAAKNLVEKDGSGDREVRALRLEAGDAQPLLEIQRDELFAHAAQRLCRDTPASQRRTCGEPLGSRRHGPEAENRAGRADDAFEAGARNLIQVFAYLCVDVAYELPRVARFEGVCTNEPLGEPDDAELEAAAQFNRRPGAPRDLDAASPYVDDDRNVPRHADPINRCQMDEPGFLRPRDDARAYSDLLGDGLKELAAVFGLPGRARRDRNDLVDAMRFGQTPELRQHLEGRVHRLGRERLAVQPTGTQTDHFLFAVNDFEGQVRSHLHHDHVDGIRADVDGGEAHRSGSLTIMRSARSSYIMPALTRRSKLLKERLDRFSRVLHGVENGDIRALHRARVASRRLRELLPLLQLDHVTANKLNRRLRRVTKRLGTVRELDVLLMLIDELHVSRRSRSAPIGRVGVAVSKARDDARKRLFHHLPIGGLRRISRKLGKLVDELAEQENAKPQNAEVKSAWRWAIEARLAKRASRLRVALNDAGAVYLPDRLHDVRIALKKFRYAVELAADAMSVDRRAELRMLTRGQEVLGRMHDLQVLIDRVRDVQASLTPPSVAVWRELDTIIESLDEDCRRLHGRYMRARDGLLVIADKYARGPAPVRTRRHATSAERAAARRVS